MSWLTQALVWGTTATLLLWGGSPAKGFASEKSSEIPNAPKIRVSLDPKAEALAKKQGFRLVGEPALLVVGDWKLADDHEPAPAPSVSPSPAASPPPGPPESPRLPAVPSLRVKLPFELSPSMEALDPELKPIQSFKNGGKSGETRSFRAELVIRKPSTVSEITAISADGSVTPIPVRIEFLSSQPILLLDPDCAELGISADAELRDLNARSSPPVAFVRCGRSGSRILIKAWSWKGTRWTTLPTGWKSSPEQPVATGQLPLFPEEGQAQTLRLSLSDADPKPHERLAVLLTHSEARRLSWNVSGSLGPTWSSYRETAAGLPEIQVSQLGLTAKVQAQFRIVPPRWDAALSVFGTVAPLSHSPDTLPSARWLGLNLRAGYQIPLDPQWRNTVTLLPGFYAWSMYVADDAYGVQNLNGPQLVVAASHVQGTPIARFGMLERYGGYVKFAVMDSGLSVTTPSNNELALGANMVVRFFGVPHPVSFALDWSTLGFSKTDFSMHLSTFSLSAGYSFN